ncbi:unnamed protein product [Brachionus calyciflorus]|uniref:Uncharacterized protein n=1 Tax=Brachionus calyciflorus TaxID=104777 RepID=A0A814KEW7_9BILA|nr:unnamed protein product [Brachionus calyciflorus]
MSNGSNLGNKKCPKYEKIRFKDIPRSQYFSINSNESLNEVKLDSKSVKDLISSLIEAAKKKVYSKISLISIQLMTKLVKKRLVDNYLGEMKDSSIRTKSQAFAIYLFWLKTG